MNSTSHCEQPDMFAVPTAVTTIRLELHIPVEQANGKLNCHVPSFKNSKILVAKTPQGKPLDRPFLATKPEYQRWMEKAVTAIESQFLSACQTTSDATPPEPSKLFAMLSLLPPDDSVRELREGSWKVVDVPKGQEGAVIIIERLT